MKVLGVAASVMALALTACTTNDSSSTNDPSPPPASTAAGPLKWEECNDGFQCAKVKVPLNYADPSGETISLALIRLPAKGKRVGSLITNPGGPGGSGVDFIRDSGRAFGPDLQQSFDIIGFDPRGVGQSSPIRCLTGPELDSFFETDTSPDEAAERTRLEEVSKKFASGCDAKAGKLLPHVGTKNAARDIDAIRAAVGDEKLTYYGASYGTYLGAWYAEQFPQNVRALVLDGAVDPALSASETNIEQAKGFETALRAFAADCVKKPTCPLGTGSVDAALDKVSALLSTADRNPLRNTSDQRNVDESLVALGLATPLYQRAAWPALATALEQAFSGDGTTLLRFADLLVERNQDGTYKNQSEANMAVNCVDKPNPDLNGFAEEADEAKKAAPRFGQFIVWSTLPCAYWPSKPTEDPRPLTAKGAAPILVVGTTRDPATPYEWSKNLASQLDSGVLLTYEGDGHTAYLGGPKCITTAVETYLIKAQPPTPDTRC